MLYLITTQGKSGSTMLAQMLHNAGIQMWAKESDFNEDPAFDEILHMITVDLDKRVIGVDKPFPIRIYDWIKEDIALAYERYDSEDWGFKSPLLIHTYDELKPYLPEHKVIHIYRNPREIYGYRSNKYNVLTAWEYIQNKAEKIADLMVNYTDINTHSLSRVCGRKIENIFTNKKRNRQETTISTDELERCYKRYEELNAKNVMYRM